MSQTVPAANSPQVLSEYFAVSTGTRVQLFSSRTRKLVKTITRFDDIAYSGSLRADGRVLLAAEETGRIQAFDASSRSILKTWTDQRQPVHAVAWNPRSTTSLMSCGDDTTVRLYELSEEAPVSTFRGHTDYVRTGCFLPTQSSSDILVSGSYDSTIRLWDPRVSGCVMKFAHTSPIEYIVPTPSGTTLYAAAGSTIAVLDVIAGRPQHIIRNHQKTVTSLCLASNSTRLVAGGLDGHVKIFETTGHNVVAGIKYAAPILSLLVVAAGTYSAREDKHLVVGLSDGTLSIRTRLTGDAKIREAAREKEMQALLAGRIEEHDRKLSKLAAKKGKGWEKRLRGRDYNGRDAEIVMDGNPRSKADKKMKLWDTAMHVQRYAEALDLAIASRQKPIVHKILDEMRYRGAIRAALEGRNEQALTPILHWVTMNISTPEYTNICVEVTMHILDIYAKHVSSSPPIQRLVDKLSERVGGDVARSQQAIQTRGMLELLVPELAG